MPRSVNAVASRRRRKKIMKAARGYFGGRSKVYTVAKNAVERAMKYAFKHRREKKSFQKTLDRQDQCSGKTLRFKLFQIHPFVSD